MVLFVPVRNTEVAYGERSELDAKAEAAHRAFDTPHTLARGAKTELGARDAGEQVESTSEIK
jgi:hypothetical protein